MKNLYRFLLLFIFLFGWGFTYGEVVKYRSTAFSCKVKDDSGVWGDWKEWTESNVLITFDSNNCRITIYSKEKQVFDIAEDEGEGEDVDGYLVHSYFCVDDDGATCRIRLILLTKDNDFQLYVDYDDMMWVYNVYIPD